LPFLVAAALWSVVIAAAVITILLGSFALAGGRPNLANLVGLVALCIGFTPLISGISLGQEVLPALAGVIAALWLGRRRGGWSSGVVTLFCGFKATIAALLVPLRSPDHVLAGRTSARLHRARTSRGQRGLGNRAASQRPRTPDAWWGIAAWRLACRFCHALFRHGRTLRAERVAERRPRMLAPALVEG